MHRCALDLADCNLQPLKSRVRVLAACTSKPKNAAHRTRGDSEWAAQGTVRIGQPHEVHTRASRGGDRHHRRVLGLGPHGGVGGSLELGL